MPDITSCTRELVCSGSHEEISELVRFLELWCVGGVLEPDEAFAWSLQGVVVALGRFAWRNLVQSALRHDDGHIEAGQGADQVNARQLGQQRGLRGH